MDMDKLSQENQDLYLECEDEEVNFSPADTQHKYPHDIVIKIFFQGQQKHKKYVCQLCSEHFSTSPKFTEHMKTIHQIFNPFKCSLCSYSTAVLKYFNQHFRKRHNVKESRLNDEKHTQNSVQCYLDNGKDTSKNICHFNSSKNESTEEKFVCNDCGFKCKQIRTFKLHRASHSKTSIQFTCKTCLKSFISETSLKRHAKTHSTKRDFICPVETCDKAFKVKGSLTDHIKIVHEKKPKYKIRHQVDDIKNSESQASK